MNRDPTQKEIEEMQSMLDVLVEQGLLVMVGYAEDGQKLYELPAGQTDQ